MIHRKDWDINEVDTGKVHEGKPVMGATLQNGLNDQETDGSFVPCNMGLDAVADGVTTHRVKRGRYGELRFSDTGSANKHLCKIKYKDGKGLSFKYLGGDSGLPDVANGKPSFVADNSVIIEHTPTYKGVRIELVINDPLTAPLEYSFSMKTYGQTYTYIEQDGGIVARGEDLKAIAIHDPYAVDANGEEGPVTMVLTEVVGGLQTFKKVVDEAWFRNAAAPVRIDPNITIEDGVAGGIIEDNFIWSSNPTSNYGTFAGGRASTTASEVTYVDLSSLAGVTPLNGKYICTTSGSGEATFKAYKLLKRFVESESTWNIYKTGSSWETAGAKGVTDRAAVEEGTFLGVSPSGTVVNIDITVATLTEWLTTNNGLLLEHEVGTGSLWQYTSAESATDPVQFYMEYTEAAAFNPSWAKSSNLVIGSGVL